MGDELSSHEENAVALRAAVIASGDSAAALRAAALERDAGGPGLPEPYDALVRQVSADSVRVTDEQVAAVRAALGSDRAVFELILASAVGAGLRRWDAAVRVIRGQDDAPA
ncbi:hypothetical protein [Leifsonia sp. Leaf336]|uniref:hypothetical protein n=1 Tax=Leifsonia sp. Leaf336 TaxID=1736341 RepID=UPI0012F9AEFE|nr:hypothetical protein [Leifsonia sp. Leaf336]